MYKHKLILVFILVFNLLRAQYFNPEAYVLQNVKSLKVPDTAAKNEKRVAFSNDELQTLKQYLVQSANNSISGRYKIALENAILAARLSEKKNIEFAIELSVLMQSTIYNRLKSFKNVIGINQSLLKTPEIIFQVSYIEALAQVAMANFEETENKCLKIINEQQLSSYDKAQVLKLTASALEKDKSYLEALKVTDLAITMLEKIKTESFERNCNQKLFYYVINNETYKQKLFIEQLTLQNNIGFLLLKNNELNDAEIAFLNALSSAKNNNEKGFELLIEKNLGLTYTLLKQYVKADDHYSKAIELAQAQNNELLKAELLCIKAKNTYLSGNLSKATSQCMESIEIAESKKNYLQLSESYSVLSEINAFVGDIQKSSYYSKLSEENASKANINKNYKSQEELVYTLKEEVSGSVFSKEKSELELIQFKLESIKKAQELEIIKRESEIKESNLNAERLETEKSQQSLLMIKRELDNVNQLQELEQIKKDRAINILVNNNNQIKIRLLNKQRKFDTQIKAQREKDVKDAKEREKSLRVFLFISLIIMGLIVFLLYRNIKNSKIIKSANSKLEELTINLQSTNSTLESTLTEVNTKNEIIEAKNYQILESITYAKRIQEASLPTSAELQSVSKDSFVIHKPKDIISGDFYIVNSFSNRSSADLSIYIVGDCTGHGVPGAMLSLLCSSLIMQSINPSTIYSPAELLDDVNEKLKNFFRNKEDDSFKDGMDIACCLVDRVNNKLYFAGAGRPLLHIRENNITELKGEKHHIGFSGTNFNFADQVLDIKSGDTIYLFTDGYTDQFNGVTRKRFMTKNLKELLLKLNTKPMSVQAEELDREFEVWKGNYAQLDDVCVLGIKI